MASGVQVNDDCKTVFEEIKKDKKYKYVIFHIKEEKEICVEALGDKNATYDDFLVDIQRKLDGGKSDCRYGLFDYVYEHQCEGTTEASKKQKLLGLTWCPDDAPIKKKMLYSSSLDALKKALMGVSKWLQATDSSESSQGAVEEKLRSGDRV